jgi:hypothetical protein
VPNFTKKILGALGMQPTRKPPPKNVTGPKIPERLALIQTAMVHYNKNAPALRGTVEGALKELGEKTPNFNDVDSVARLLGIHQAHLTMRRLMNHRERRYLVLVGLRELLEQKPNPDPPRPKKIAVRR